MSATGWLQAARGRLNPPPAQPEHGALPTENIYGHLARVHWMARHLRSTDRVLEVGCGTGWRVTLPLRQWGFDVQGTDVDAASIEYGRGLFARAGQPGDALKSDDLRTLDGGFDAIIVSEVLEHLDDPSIEELLALIRSKLAPGGTLIVTVPNGRGWFELEAFLWWRTGVGKLLTASGLAFAIRRLRAIFVAGPTRNIVPSTLSSTPHVQRFNLRSIQDRLRGAGFEVVDASGSVLFAGPFSDLLFTGSHAAQVLNRRLGVRFPRAAAGFYVAATAPAA